MEIIADCSHDRMPDQALDRVYDALRASAGVSANEFAAWYWGNERAIEWARSSTDLVMEPAGCGVMDAADMALDAAADLVGGTWYESMLVIMDEDELAEAF